MGLAELAEGSGGQSTDGGGSFGTVGRKSCTRRFQDFPPAAPVATRAPAVMAAGPGRRRPVSVLLRAESAPPKRRAGPPRTVGSRRSGAGAPATGRTGGTGLQGRAGTRPGAPVREGGRLGSGPGSLPAQSLPGSGPAPCARAPDHRDRAVRPAHAHGRPPHSTLPAASREPITRPSRLRLEHLAATVEERPGHRAPPGPRLRLDSRAAPRAEPAGTSLRPARDPPGPPPNPGPGTRIRGDSERLGGPDRTTTRTDAPGAPRTPGGGGGW